MRLLDAEEALDPVVRQAVDLARHGRDRLDEANHALVALRVELAVVAGLQARHLCKLDVRSVVLQRVAEVGEEPHAVFELDLVRLIVDS